MDKMNKKYILMSLVLFLTIIVLGGCFTKKSITSSEFKNIMEKNGYTISENQEEHDFDGVDESFLAVKTDKYQIEFYTFNQEILAEGFFEEKVNEFVSLEDGNNIKTSQQGSNYKTYSITTEDVYAYISRIDDTLLYVNVDKEYKDEVQTSIKELNY